MKNMIQQKCRAFFILFLFFLHAYHAYQTLYLRLSTGILPQPIGNICVEVEGYIIDLFHALRFHDYFSLLPMAILEPVLRPLLEEIPYGI